MADGPPPNAEKVAVGTLIAIAVTCIAYAVSVLVFCFILT
jgi:hypothetical protein